MIDDIKSSLSSVFRERVSSPFYGSFLFSWAIWNWKIIYLTLFVSYEQIKPLTKVEYISKYYLNWSTFQPYLHSLVLPLISAVSLIILVPFGTNWLYRVYLKFERQRIEEKEKVDANRRLTVEEGAKLKNAIFELELRLEKQRESNESSVRFNEAQLNSLRKEVTNCEKRYTELRTDTESFRILTAQYGKGFRFIDVTQMISNALPKDDIELKVDNTTLGGDPVPNTRKILFVAYQVNNKIYSFFTKEFYKIRRTNGLLYAKHTEESVILDDSTSDEQLEMLFPGEWLLEWNGPHSGSEHFIIKSGGVYCVKNSQGEWTDEFTIVDLRFEQPVSSLYFTKVGVKNYDNQTENSLEIVTIGKLYEGTENNGKTKVTYKRLPS